MVEEQRAEPKWLRSAYCASDACVEVARNGTCYLVRDSKDPDGPVLSFSRAEWEAFEAGLVAGNFTFE